MDHNAYKLNAKLSLEGKWRPAAIGALVFAVLSGEGLFVGNTTTTVFGNVTFNYASLLAMLLTGPLTLGFIYFIIELINGNEEYGLLFKGFKRFSDTFIYHFLTSIIIIMGFILLIVPGIMFAMSYSMGYLIMKDDPDLTATEAMKLSKEMMMGNKMDFFMFCLSFIGWVILSIITIGIGFLFLHPYFTASHINYYEALKERERYT
jgi:uncharacterized membrane protein